MPKIQRAVLSVHDKSGILELAQALSARKVDIIATGGTARYLHEHGLAVTSIEQVTGFPEILDGRVKTLHPKIFGALLARRDSASHLEQLAMHEIGLIDLVVVNLYPFREVISRPAATLEEALENIDIGGVALIRAAAKNYMNVAIVTSPQQYSQILAEFEEQGGGLSDSTRLRLALAAYAYTAGYDAAIAGYLQARLDEAEALNLPVIALEKIQNLRYGENPHQRAAFFRSSLSHAPGLAGARQLQGKELSYNNLVDADTALNMVRMFQQPACAIVKHANPCGVAIGETPEFAFANARATDPASAFGGVLGFNREMNIRTAEFVTELFTEVILAPGFSAEAQAIFAKKKNVRLLQIDEMNTLPAAGLECKNIAGGLLLQDQDLHIDDPGVFHAVTLRPPTEEEWAALLFGWKVVRWVKSNAIVYCKPDRTLGIGAGQMSRVDAARLGIEKARAAGLLLTGAALASDAFFPFADGIEVAAAAGVTAVVQPGGSVRDHEVIAAANRNGLAMVFTGVRHFRH